MDQQMLSQLERDIIDQVEYYFGDANLYRDEFLQAEILKNDGWVLVSTLITFKRLAALTTDVKVIADALDKSDEGLVEISEDRQSIRRHPRRPLPKKTKEKCKEIIIRTAYVKGFPKLVAMPQLIAFFKDHPKVEHISIEKQLGKSVGNVYVTFSSRDQCAAFLGLNDIKFNGKQLVAKWRSDGRNNKLAAERRMKLKAYESEIELPKGALLVISGIKSNDTKRDSVKETFEQLGNEIASVELFQGKGTGIVRFTHENGAKEFVAKLEGDTFKLSDDEINVDVLDGDDEEKCLRECKEKLEHRRLKRNHFNAEKKKRIRMRKIQKKT